MIVPVYCFIAICLLLLTRIEIRYTSRRNKQPIRWLSGDNTMTEEEYMAFIKATTPKDANDSNLPSATAS